MQTAPNKFSQDDAYRLKLKPIETDNHVFQSVVNEDNASSSTNKASRIQTNYEWFKRELGKRLTTPEEADSFIEAFERLVIVEMELESSDDPQLIFESLNSAGKKLDESDLIRNCVLMNHNPDEQKRLYRAYWEPIEKNTFNENTKIDDANETTAFVRHFLTAKLGRFVKKNDVFSTFKEEVKKTVKLDIFLEELKRFSGYYYYLTTGNSPDPELNKCIQNINKLNTKVCYSLLLCILEAHYHYQSTPFNKLIKAFELIESFLCRRSIVELSNKQLNKVFPLLITRVKNRALVPQHSYVIIEP